MTDDLIETMARAICAETCAFMGEPACHAVSDGAWPPETCCEPGCVAEAEAALAAMIAAGAVKGGEHD